MGLIDQTERYSLSNVGKAWLPQLSVSGKASYQSDVTKLPLDGDKISSLLPGFEDPKLEQGSVSSRGAGGPDDLGRR